MTSPTVAIRGRAYQNDPTTTPERWAKTATTVSATLGFRTALTGRLPR
jgi:hypothetical protein